MESMAIEGTLEGIESVLAKENLAKIKEEYAISLLVRLEVLGPSDRMIMGSVTCVVQYEDALKARLRFLILVIVAKLLRWY